MYFISLYVFSIKKVYIKVTYSEAWNWEETAIQETVKEHSVLSLNFFGPNSTYIFILFSVFCDCFWGIIWAPSGD